MRTHPPPSRPARIGAVGLLILTAPVFAQGLMRPPVAPQAIESHLEQRRTLEQLEQRETEEAKKDTAPHAATAPHAPPRMKARPAASKSRKPAKSNESPAAK